MIEGGSQGEVGSGAIAGLRGPEAQMRLEALAASEHRFRAVFESAAGGMVLVTPSGVILLANDSAGSRSGYAPDELHGRNIMELVHPEERDRTAEALRGYREGRYASFRYETRYVHRTGVSVNVLVSTALARDAAGEPFIVVQLHDVTERDRLKLELLHAQKLEAIGRLAAGIAHDFNNVLTVITTYADFVIAAMDEDDGRLADVMEIRKAADTGAALSRQLLSFGRQKPGASRIVGVNTVVSETLRLLRRTFGSRIIITATLSPEPLNIRIDPSQLEQVIMNLALNARDAMPEGGTLSLTTSKVQVEPGFHGASKPGTYVCLTVADTGIGMDAATQSRIFEPFFTTKPAQKGTGLGLSTVYRIVQQQGGFIAVDSDRGRGTKFEVHFASLETGG